MTTFALEPFRVVEENKHLIEEHWKEVVRDNRKLDPHWEFFRSCEKMGLLRTYVARDKGEVVGYAVFALHPHLHSRYLMSAHNDAVFLSKEKRACGVGFRMLKWCTDDLVAEGMGCIYWHVKTWLDFGPALEKLGYSLAEKGYVMFPGDK